VYITGTPKTTLNIFFLFPTDHSRCQDWISCIKLKFQNFNCDIKHAKVCDAHFSNKQFTNSLHNRLSTFAIPDIVGEEDKLPLSTFVTSDIVTEDYSLPGTSSGKTSTSRRLDVDISESMNLSASDMVDLADTVDLEDTFTPNRPLQPREVLSNKLPTVLSKIGFKRKCELSPRKRYLYGISQRQKCQLHRLQKKILKAKCKIRAAETISNSKLFKQLEQSINKTGVQFIESQFRNCNVKAHGERWSHGDKVFALALYKRGPRSYRFLKRFLKLPSKSTLQSVLRSVPFDSGINASIFEKLKFRVNKMKKLEKYCCLMFDEMSLSYDLNYDHALRKIIGFVDLGSGKRSQMFGDP